MEASTQICLRLFINRSNFNLHDIFFDWILNTIIVLDVLGSFYSYLDQSTLIYLFQLAYLRNFRV